MKKGTSPYLNNQWRLSDVIAAIQALGSYPWASRKVDKWTKKLGDTRSAGCWDQIFEEHPEFFRLNEDWGSLRWRHAYDRTYDAELGRELRAEEIERMSDEEKRNLTRKPLEAGQIEALMKTAVELHSRAIAQRQENRWWLPIITALAAAIFGFLGAIVGALLKP